MGFTYDKNNPIISKLCSIWDINHPYWYPLYDCNRIDIISLESDCLEVETLKNILMKNNISKIFEFREDGLIKEINIKKYLFWDNDDYLPYNECFWFDLSMNWIVYKSHEGMTTLGSEWLVKEIKQKITNWKSFLMWDTKNNQ